jgi:hypothetical protein
MTEEQYAREYELEPLVVTEASICGTLLLQARKDGRIGHVPHQPGADVHTAWDFSFRDLTAVWFIQHIGPAFHVVDFLQASGLTVADYAEAGASKNEPCGRRAPDLRRGVRADRGGRRLPALGTDYALQRLHLRAGAVMIPRRGK